MTVVDFMCIVWREGGGGCGRCLLQIFICIVGGRGLREGGGGIARKEAMMGIDEGCWSGVEEHGLTHHDVLETDSAGWLVVYAGWGRGLVVEGGGWRGGIGGRRRPVVNTLTAGG